MSSGPFVLPVDNPAGRGGVVPGWTVRNEPPSGAALRVSHDVRLRSALSCTWPVPGTVQLGLSRRFGVVLSGLDEEDARLIDRLGRPHDRRIPRTQTSPRSRRLLHLLAGAGVLARLRDPETLPHRLAPDAAVWSIVHACADDGGALVAARANRSVIVVGAGRLGGALAATLAAAGVGRVGVVDPFRMTPGDLGPVAPGAGWLGRHRRDAAAERVRETGSAATTSERLAVTVTDRPDLVVLIEHAAADAAAADELVSADVAHLSVLVRDAEVVVGPLVVPGAGPCLRCLDMHRGDRDTGWSRTLRQLLADRAGNRLPEETAVSTLAAGLAALQVLAHLDAVVTPAALGATLEIELPQGLTARRTWPVHPRCGCSTAF